MQCFAEVCIAVWLQFINCIQTAMKLQSNCNQSAIDFWEVFASKFKKLTKNNEIGVNKYWERNNLSRKIMLFETFMKLKPDLGLGTTFKVTSGLLCIQSFCKTIQFKILSFNDSMTCHFHWIIDFGSCFVWQAVTVDLFAIIILES